MDKGYNIDNHEINRYKMSNRFKMVRLRRELYDMLTADGKKGECYSDIISRKIQAAGKSLVAASASAAGE